MRKFFIEHMVQLPYNEGSTELKMYKFIRYSRDNLEDIFKITEEVPSNDPCYRVCSKITVSGEKIYLQRYFNVSNEGWVKLQRNERSIISSKAQNDKLDTLFNQQNKYKKLYCSEDIGKNVTFCSRCLPPSLFEGFDEVYYRQKPCHMCISCKPKFVTKSVENWGSNPKTFSLFLDDKVTEKIPMLAPSEGVRVPCFDEPDIEEKIDVGMIKMGFWY